MTYILIDNTQNIESAKMTPLIIDYFKKQNIKLEVISKLKPLPSLKKIKGVILSGGPIRLTNKICLDEVMTNINAIVQYPDIPILGICFGYQIISLTYGGKIKELENKKKGINEFITIEKKSSILYKNMDKDKISVFQFHNDYIDTVPRIFDITAKDSNNIVQSIENQKIMRFGTQFHPEASEDRDTILQNFIDFCDKKAISDKNE